MTPFGLRYEILELCRKSANDLIPIRKEQTEQEWVQLLNILEAQGSRRPREHIHPLQGNHQHSASCLQRLRSHLRDYIRSRNDKQEEESGSGPLKLPANASYQNCHLVILIFQAQADCQVTTKTGLTTDFPIATSPTSPVLSLLPLPLNSNPHKIN